MRRGLIIAAAYLLFVIIVGVLFWNRQAIFPTKPIDSFDPKPVIEKVSKLRATTKSPTFEQLVETYKDLGIIDAHNHDASDMNYLYQTGLWKRANIEKVVLFGDASEPSAVTTDSYAWGAYERYPDQFLPYFSGFDLRSADSLEVIKKNLEIGYFGLGEIIAASTNSPVVSHVAWKGQDPMSGYLPKIYDLIAEYKAPILLHIDPPTGTVMAILEKALDQHPNTTFIFGHINAYSTPSEIDAIMEKHPNLYADFFAGFSIYNNLGRLQLDEFIPIIKKYPDRCMISTDSGYGMEKGEEQAIEAMYRLIDKLDDPVIARKIAHTNLMKIIEAQPATKTQLDLINKLSESTGKKYDTNNLSKLEAGKILVESNVF